MIKHIFAAAVAALAAGCEDTADKGAARAAAARDEARLANYIAEGPKVVSTAALADGTLRAIELPKRGIGPEMAEVQTCILFTHNNGSSSLSCSGEAAILFSSDVPQ